MSVNPTAADLEMLSEYLAKRGHLSRALLEGPGFTSAVRLRMHELQLDDAAVYTARVMSGDSEFQRLAGEISVPETWFFRYPASFEFALQHLRELRRSRGGQLVCASLGCATGVEAWSNAACALAAGWPSELITVYAVDRNESALHAAREGRISAGSVRGSIPEWARPWITQSTHSLELSREVRTCVKFLSGDIVTTDNLIPPGIDLLFCRNVLIYLDAPARIALRDRLANWLGRDGILLLGHADALDRGDRFESVGDPSVFALRHREVATTVDGVAPRPVTGHTNPRRPVVSHSTRTPSAHSEETTSQPTHTASSQPVNDLDATLRSLSAMILSGDLAQARKVAEAALERAPSRVDLLESLAGILSSQNELERAHQIYQRVVYLEPDHGPALLALAELSAALGRGAEADRYRARVKRLIDS